MAEDYEVTDFKKDILDMSRAIPVVVDFWAPWCTPCTWLEPVITALAEEKKQEWKLVKVNTDLHPELAAEYHIQGIPAIRIFRNGEIVGRFNGMMYKSDLSKWIDEALAARSS